jgi:peptide/nickel transport system substrate-binding protein
MMSGQADLALTVDPVTLTILAEHPDVELIQTSGATALFLAMWTDTPPFDDLRVRTAMKLVVDREAIVKTVLLGYGEPGNDVPVPPSSSNAYRLDIKPRDVEKAKQLLAEAGHPDGLEVDLYTSGSYPGMKLLALAYAEMAKDAGIKGQRRQYARRGILGHHLAEIPAGHLLHGREAAGRGAGQYLPDDLPMERNPLDARRL